MRAIRSRITRIERDWKGEAVEDKTQHYKLMWLINRCLVRKVPGLEQVRPKHTDPETYGDIQEKLAGARGYYAEAERLHDLDPDTHVPLRPGTPWEERMWRARETLDRCPDEAAESCGRVAGALRAAGFAAAK